MNHPRVARRFASLGLVALLAVALAAPADATFGGRAGRISFAREIPDKDGPGLTGLEIFSAKPDGKGVQRLTWSNDGRTSFMSDWSPDGSRIAFDSDRIDRDGRDDVVQIYTMPWNGETHGLTQLTVGPGFHGDPAYSRDGQWLAIEADWGDFETLEGIWIIPSTDPDGVTQADAQRVTTSPPDSFESEPQFSPDGQWIVFTRFEYGAGRQAIWRVRTDGTGLKRLTDYKLEASYPDFSPDGESIAFDSNDSGAVGGRGDIWVMDADGRHPKRLTHNPKVTDTKFVLANNPSWSPDGKRIVFTQWQKNGAVQLRSVKANGGGDKLVVGGEFFQNKADWGSHR